MMLWTLSLTAQETGFKIGDKVTDFNLKNVYGAKMGMSSYANAKGFIIIFTCNHCPYSVKYEDRIIELHNKYINKGYPVIAINPNDPKVSPEDSYKKMKVRAEEKKFPFNYLYDADQSVAKTYGATRTPHVFLVKKEDNGDLKLVYKGAIDNNPDDATAATKHYVQQALVELGLGASISEPETKSIGCTIKWKKK